MSKKTIILTVLALLGLAGTMVGTLFFAKLFLFQDPAHAPAAAAAPAPAAAPKDPIYESIEPAFVVNILDGARYRYLQIQVDVMSRDQAAITRFGKYQPRIKGELTMLFSAVTSEQAHAADGRQALQKDTLAAINRILTEEAGSGGIEAVYFSKFVVQ